MENVLGAVAAARLLGIESEAIVKGVAHVGGVPGRFEAVDEGQPFTVLVDKQGRVAAVYLLPLSAKDLQPVLNKLIAES